MTRWMHRTIVVVLLSGTALVGGAAAAWADCKPDGVPNAAGTGVAGMIDDPVPSPSKQTRYGEYGWGGYLWHTCDLGIGPDSSADTGATWDTEVGNAGLRLATTLGATMTQLHEWTADPGAITGPLDAVLEDTTQIVADSTWGQWAPALILLAAALTITQALNGDVRRALRTGGAILAATFVVAWVLTPRPGGQVTIRTPDGTITTQAGARSGAVEAARTFDGLVSDVVAGVDRSILNLPFMGSSPTVSADEARGATMADRVIYPLWARGALGSDEATRQYGAKLYAASATKYGAPAAGDAAKDRYQAVADAVSDKDRSWYDTLRGKARNRAGQGFLAAVFMATIALIRIPAEALVLVGLIVMRLAVMFAPLFAALAILEATRGHAKTVLKVVIASVVNVVIFGIIAAVHTAIVGAVIVNASSIVALVTIVVATVAVWILSKPFRSATKLATAGETASAIEGVGAAPAKAWAQLAAMASGGAGVVGSYLGSRAGRHNDDPDEKDPPKRTGQEQWTRVYEQDTTRDRPRVTTQTPAAGNVPNSTAPRPRRQLALDAAFVPAGATADDPRRAAGDPRPPTTAGTGGRPGGDGHRDVVPGRAPSPSTDGQAPELFIPGRRPEQDDAATTRVTAPAAPRLIEPEYDRDGVLTYDLFMPATKTPTTTRTKTRTGVGV